MDEQQHPKRVYKYPFPVDDTVTMKLPAGAVIVHFDWIPNAGIESLLLWAIVDPVAELRPVTLHVRGTGHEFNGMEGKHLATVLVDGGVLVWHVFASRGDDLLTREWGPEEWAALPDAPPVVEAAPLVGIAPDYAESAE